MYLSKVILKWPACRNPYEWHRLIWRLFPHHPDSKRKFQFACLNRTPGRDISVLLFSLESPKSLQSPEIALVSEAKSVARLSFNFGQKLRFRLIANPAKVVTEKTGEKRKVRVPLIKQDQQATWLKKHLAGSAEIQSVVCQNQPPLYFNRNGYAGKIVPVSFEGVLKVLGSEKLREQIYEKYNEKGEYIAGIGPAKAFGCGLMLVRRI